MSGSSGIPHRRPGQRAGLQKETVLKEARELVERDGIAALTMRRLAARLAVAPNTLYSHVADKSTLVAAVVDSFLTEIEIPAHSPAEWRDGLTALMSATRRFLAEHPDLLPHLMSQPGTGANAIRLGETSLRYLEGAGLGGKEAIDAQRILLIYTFGFVALETPRRADPDPEMRRRRSLAAFADPGSGPHVRVLSELLASQPDEDTFEKGLTWILDGISRNNRAGPEGSPTGSPSNRGA